jgi:hypothetical protein
MSEPRLPKAYPPEVYQRRTIPLITDFVMVEKV